MGGLGKSWPRPSIYGSGYDPTIDMVTTQAGERLLKQAGYPDGVDITMHTIGSAWGRQMGRYCRNAYEVGLRTSLKIWDQAAWAKSSERTRNQWFYSSWGYYSTLPMPSSIPLSQSPVGWKMVTRIPGLDQLIDELVRQLIGASSHVRQINIREKRQHISLPSAAWGSASAWCMSARGDEWIWVYDAEERNRGMAHNWGLMTAILLRQGGSWSSALESRSSPSSSCTSRAIR